MQKETLFTKLKIKDYNNALESILEQKNFTLEVKNLLLSMLYKIENSFEDFKTVKVEVEDKDTYIEEILTIIRVYCKKIEFVKPRSKEAEILETLGLHYIAEGGTIITYQNEEYLLTALLKLKVTTKIEEEYETYAQIVNKAIHEMTVKANIIHNIQVIKDFDGWTWNLSPLTPENELANILYVNLVYLMGIQEIVQAIFERDHYQEILQKKLQPYFKKEDKEAFLNRVIALCIRNLMQEKEGIYYTFQALKTKEEKEYILLGNLDTYLENTKLEEQQTAQRLAEIDILLKDEKKLKKAYQAENKKRPEHKKIVSMSAYEDYLKSQKMLIRQKNLQYKQTLNPRIQEEKREKIKQTIDLYTWIEQDNTKEKLLELQILFLQAFTKKIEKAKTKKEIISYLYMLRYYNLIKWQRKPIGTIRELQEILTQTKRTCLQKALELKAITKMYKEDADTVEILLPIFQTKIIQLEKVMVKIEDKENITQLQIYDENTLEEKINLPRVEGKKIKNKSKLIS